MVEGKISGNSSELPFKLILSQKRRENLINLYKSYSTGDPKSIKSDGITTPYSKLVKTIKPDANFDWRKDPKFHK